MCLQEVTTLGNPSFNITSVYYEGPSYFKVDMHDVM